MRVLSTARPPVLARILRWYLRSTLRGRTRLTAILTRHLRPLWSVPIRIQDCAPLYVDLRSGHAQYLLQGEPWTHAPREQPEQDAMRRVVARGDVVAPADRHRSPPGVHARAVTEGATRA